MLQEQDGEDVHDDHDHIENENDVVGNDEAVPHDVELELKEPRDVQLRRPTRECFLDGDLIILLLYVDNMLIVGHDVKKIDKLKKDLNKSFAMKDLGPAKQIIGMRITRDRSVKKFWLSQEKYIEEVLEIFHMDIAKQVATHLANHFKLSFTDVDMAGDINAKKSTLGYLITYSGGVVSWQSRMKKCVALSTARLSLSNNESLQGYIMDEKILTRVGMQAREGTLSHGLHYPSASSLQLTAYFDADWGCDLVDRRSTTGLCFLLGNSLISWRSKKQSIVSRSSTEFEYRALADTTAELV
ncbi:hypothetical protein RJ639_021314 [Escallonia herrerae]|uniref:Reverse transcriptase Ty1/copia-type domain-containing protein n=1 Tax=Escallonia herrerae TaxID=1293975 RepID=A0AA89AFS6_9ASTE|nr:hypothetical protein RJ639_021314 [Escallonia herrerae]